MRKGKVKRDTNIVVAISTELKEKFASICDKEFITMSSKIHQLINEYMKDK
jgi:hypothetical protein